MTNKTLPEALFRYVLINALLGAGLLILAVGAAIFFKDPKDLVALVLPLYFWFICYHTVRQYRSGTIIAVPAYCLSVQKNSIMTKNCAVMFKIEAEDLQLEGDTLTIYAARKGCPYVENMAYVLYISKANPHSVLAHELAG